MRVVLINYEQTLLSALTGFLETFQELLIVGAFRDEEEALAKIQPLEPRFNGVFRALRDKEKEER